jgi:hypothetical protein
MSALEMDCILKATLHWSSPPALPYIFPMLEFDHEVLSANILRGLRSSVCKSLVGLVDCVFSTSRAWEPMYALKLHCLKTLSQ